MLRGLRSIANRLLCSTCSIPCTVALSLSKLPNIDREKSTVVMLARTFVLVSLVVFFSAWFLSYYVVTWFFPSITHSSERHSGRHVSEDGSFELLYNMGAARENTKEYEKDNFPRHMNDKFAQANYVHLKLRHLISLGYLSSPLYSYPKQKANVGETLSLEESSHQFRNFSFLLNDLNIALNLQNFYLRQWGCQEIGSMKFSEPYFKTKHSMAGNVEHNGKTVALQESVADVDELVAAKCGSSDSDRSQDNVARCFLLKNRRLLQQYLFLQELSHPNIVKPYGVCVSYDSKGTASALTLAKEGGMAVDLSKVKSLPWSQRLKLSHDLANLAAYLADNVFGSVRLESWVLENFVLLQESMTLKLSNFDQAVSLVEKTCEKNSDCSLRSMQSITKCTKGICRGYNEKVNLFNIYNSFIMPVLKSEVPTRMSEDVSKVLLTLQRLECNSSELLQLLKVLQTDSQNRLDLRKEADNKPLRPGSIHRLPDGSQVDSWEQHESHVPINEVDFNEPNVIQQDINNVGAAEENNNLKDTFGYKKIDNADYPGRYDYYCPHSKAEWGCVVSLRKLEEAAKKCDNDVKCKAFVTMPHLRKEGWIIVILKSDNTRAVDHAGTTVYIKISEGEKTQSLELKDKEWSKDNSNLVKLCLQDLVHAQESLREKREEQLMKPCGWSEMTDAKWQTMILEATVKDATTFKPSRGKMAVGGQMNVVLESTTKGPALFMAKRGPAEYHLAQLTTYHLDRMLGLYKIIPAFLRTLTEQEMADAGFPVDIGGNQFDVFRQLKNVDKSLSGTISPIVTDRIGVEHYISVPKLSQITNAVTPFSRRQWDDLEYLLLMWLASLPMPTKGHPSLQGHLIHIKADEAFKSEPASIVLQYFNNCQFPKIAVDVLRNLRTAHCNFGDQLVARVRTAYPDLQEKDFSFQVPVADIATRNANRLLEVVDLCVRKFGDDVVLYDS